MLKIRLSRLGRKNLPSYRVVVVPANSKRETRFIEEIGYFSPITKQVDIKTERALYWLGVGAQPTDTVKRLLIKQNIGNLPVDKQVFNKQPGKKASERNK